MRKCTTRCDEAVARKTQRPTEDGGGEVTAAAKACKGRLCRACAGGLIADCVAVCCCPCAVLQLLALAFVKLPWKVGSRCLGGGKMGGRRRRRQLENERKCKRSESECVVIERGCTAGMSSQPRLEGKVENDRVDGHGALMERVEVEWERSALHDDDDEVGHLAFGSVSFSGI